MAAPERPRRRFLWFGSFVLAVLAGIVFALGSLRLAFIRPASSEGTVLLYFLSTLVFLSFLVLGFVLLRSLLRVYAERQRRVLGAKFKTKMVVGALALSLLPAIALFFVSYALVNRSLAKWFPRPLEVVRDDARALARHLVSEGERRASELARTLAEDPSLRPTLERRAPSHAQAFLRQWIEQKEVAWAALSTHSGELIAVARRPGVAADFRSLLRGLGSVPERRAFTQFIGDRNFHISWAPIQAPFRGFAATAIVAVAMPMEVQVKIHEIEAESQNYEALAAERKTYNWQALLMLLFITVLVLYAATWAALYLAKQVTVPIQALALATEEVSRGNFDYRVEIPAQDELGTLVDSFNRMTFELGESRRQLEASRHRLEQTVTELEQRKQLMEAILESIPTGVLTLNQDRIVVNFNPAAARLGGPAAVTGVGLAEWFGNQDLGLLPALLDRAARLGTTSGELELRFRHRVAQLAVTISALRTHGREEGFVVVLDDLTELLRAQKAAAWQEVAQRIAHEIKNPLTPIQLSADRIRRYLERQGRAGPAAREESARLIGECATQIALEVNGLKTLVDEFSRFARFPAARLAPAQLNQIVESTLASYHTAANGVTIQRELDPTIPEMQLDTDLLRRALANLLDNAVEALNGAAAKQIVVRTRHLTPLSAVELSVADSGAGIPAETKARVFLPFYSTKPEGMGLGLAIVERIVNEHGGVIRVEDNEPSGTRFVIEFPTRAAPAL